MSTRKRPAPKPAAPAPEPEAAAEPDAAPETEPSPQPTAQTAQTAPGLKRATDGRPACRMAECDRPEFLEGIRLCGAHWSLRPDLRRKETSDD